MPEDKKRIFVNVLSKLKQKVLWKWETEEMEGKPANVLLKKWLPQQDIIGRFITNSVNSVYKPSTTFQGIPM